LPTVSELDGWKFCPRCRADLEASEGSAQCPSCGSKYYASSKPTACALCMDDDGRVLLARRASEVYHGYWDLPGGFIDEGEHPLDALRRELKEETSLDVEPDEFLGVWMDHYREDGTGPSTLNLYWTARVVGGELHAADDISDARWFAPEELPPPEELAFHIADVLSAWWNQHS
jgi:ADP-ribose pyrophosphatase YjhB (NUDIX family)